MRLWQSTRTKKKKAKKVVTQLFFASLKLGALTGNFPELANPRFASFIFIFSPFPSHVLVTLKADFIIPTQKAKQHKHTS